MDRKQMLEAAKRAASVINSKAQIPSLRGVKLSRSNGLLTLQAFDYETSVTTHVPDSGEAFAPVLVEARLLVDILAKATESTASLHVEGSKVALDTGVLYLLPTLEVADYPTLPEPGTAVAAYTADQVAAWARVLPAAGKDMTLPTLTAIHFDLGENTVLAATDRYKLFVLEQDVPSARQMQVLIPASTLNLVIRMSAGQDVRLTALGKDRLEVVGFKLADGTVITVRLFDGEFPKYRALMPDLTVPHTVATVEAKAALNLVKQVELVCDRNQPVRLEVEADGVRVKGGAGDEASAEGFMSAKTDGEGFISFNPTYLKQALAQVHGSHVELHVISSTRPAVLIEPDDPSLQALVMPVRLSG